MKLALFGYGGHAREVACQIDQEVTFFVDDEYANDIAKPISEFNPEEYVMLIAVGESKDRKRIEAKLPKETKHIEIKGYGHMDFVWSENTHLYPFKDVKDFINTIS